MNRSKYTAAVDNLLCGLSMVNGCIFKELNKNYYINEKKKTWVRLGSTS
jgi:hypothetical protein